MFLLQTNGSGVLSFAGVSASAGQVIQVITATDSTVRSSNSTSFVTGSNTLSVTITPSSASNKIFIILTTSLYAPYVGSYVTIFRGATDLGAASNKGMIYAGDAGQQTAIIMPSSISILDSPSTTSATTYQLYFRSATSAETTNINFGSSKGSITCMEIKG